MALAPPHKRVYNKASLCVYLSCVAAGGDVPGQGFIGRQPLRWRSPAPCRHRLKENNTYTHLE